jgi:hypothetical protein
MTAACPQGGKRRFSRARVNISKKGSVQANREKNPRKFMEVMMMKQEGKILR